MPAAAVSDVGVAAEVQSFEHGASEAGCIVRFEAFGFGFEKHAHIRFDEFGQTTMPGSHNRRSR
mgnify:CR=1 FL=1